MPLRMGTPFHTTGESLRTGNETNAGAGPNETKAMRGLIASTRIRRRRRMLTQVSRDLKEPGPVTTRLTVAPGTVTRRASGSVYVVVPHPIMCRIHRIVESMRGGLTADYAKSEGRAFSWKILCRTPSAAALVAAPRAARQTSHDTGPKTARTPA